MNMFQGLAVSDVHKLLTQMADLLQTIQKTVPLGIKPPETEEGVLGDERNYNLYKPCNWRSNSIISRQPTEHFELILYHSKISSV